MKKPSGIASELFSAVRKNDVKLLAELLKPGNQSNEIDVDGRTPLHHACIQGFIECINLLLQHGANILAKDNSGQTALHLAAHYGREAILNLLLNTLPKKSSVDIKDNNGKTPLHSAAFVSMPGVAQKLIEKGADINASNEHGYTPLHFAAREGHLEVVKLLLSSGANPLLISEGVDRPAIIALQFGHVQVAAWLLAAEKELIDDELFLRHYKQALYDCYSNLNDRYLAENNLTKLIKLLEQMISLEPEESHFHHSLACYYQVSGKAAQAEQQFHQALALNAKAATYTEYANFLYQQQRFKEAETAAQQALDCQDDDSSLIYDKIESVNLTPEVQAEFAYHTAIKGSANLFAHYIKVLSCLALKRAEEAKQALDKFIESYAKLPNAFAYSLIAYCYQRSNNYAQAAFWFEKAILLDQLFLVQIGNSLAKNPLAKKNLMIALQHTADVVQKPEPQLISLQYRDCLEQAEVALLKQEYKLAKQLFEQASSHAEKLRAHPAQVYCLEKIAQIYHQQQTYTDAIKWYAAAYSLHQQSPQEISMPDNILKLGMFPANLYLYSTTEAAHYKRLENQLQAVEQEFLQTIGKKANNIVPSALIYRDQLNMNRAFVREAIADKEIPIRQIVQTFTQKMCQLVEQITTDCVQILGKAPCKYTLISLGSMSRNEMSPYSDLEFAILIKKDKPEIRTYFRQLVQLLELKIIALGETSRNSYDSIIKSGFCFDLGGNTPLAAKDNVGIELIQTPKQLALYQLPENWVVVGEIGRTALQTVGYITGSHKLLQEYEAALAKVFQQSYSGHDPFTGKQVTTKTLGQFYGLLFMRDTVGGKEFAPRLDKEKEKENHFIIKKELYRLPTNILASLALFSGIPAKNSWERLDALFKAKQLINSGHTALTNVLDEIIKLRLLTHLHYQEEREDIYNMSKTRKMPAEITPKTIQNIYLLDNNEIDNLFKIYQTLLPLHQAAKLFCNSGGQDNPFLTASLYDNSLHAQAAAHAQLLQYEKALQCYQRAIAINPNDLLILNQFSMLLNSLGKHQIALDYLKRALEISRSLDSSKENTEDLAVTLNNLGMVLSEVGEYSQAEDYFKQALTMNQQIYSNSVHPDIALALNNLASVFQARANYTQAQKYYQQALEMWQQLYPNQNSPEMATYLNNLGLVCYEMRNYIQAENYHRQALTIRQKRPHHPDIAISLNNLGLVLCATTNYEEAEKCHQQALTIWKQFYSGQEHSDIALCLNNLGDVFCAKQNYAQAKDYYQQALTLWQRLYAQQALPSIATCLDNLGAVAYVQGDYLQAENYHLKALTMWQQLYPEQAHPRTLRCLDGLTNAMRAQGKTEQAENYSQQALIMQQELNPDEARRNELDQLGEVAYAKGDFVKAEACYRGVLAILEQIYKGNDHVDIAECLIKLGDATYAKGNMEQAMKYYQQVITMWQRLSPDQAKPNVATCLNNLGVISLAKGAIELAEKYHQQALTMRMKIYPNQDHSNIATSLGNVGEVFRAKRDYKQAELYYQQALIMWQKLYPDQAHSHIATCLSNLGMLFLNKSDYQTAKQHLQEALAMRQKLHPNQIHPDLGVALNNLGEAYRKSGELKIAIKYHQQALTLWQQYYEDEPHYRIVNTLMILGTTSRDLGQLQLAKKYLITALMESQAIYEENHPVVMLITQDLYEIEEALQELSSTQQSSTTYAKLFAQGIQLDDSEELESPGSGYQETLQISPHEAKQASQTPFVDLKQKNDLEEAQDEEKDSTLSP